MTFLRDNDRELIPELTPEPTKSKLQEAALSLHNIEMRFGAKAVLKGINLHVDPGQFLAVVGKSGSGKSTMLRLIAGLDAPTNGQILMDGKPLRGLNLRSRTMFQDARLLPWQRILNNVAIGLQGRHWESTARDALAKVGLSDRASEYPSVLSGGERQRVALARALVTRPALLLLDEPLGALDALTRIEMQRLLESIWIENRFTAVLITHDVEEAISLADRVVLIENGQIALSADVDLPRPRPRTSPAFTDLKEHILNYLLNSNLR